MIAAAGTELVRRYRWDEQIESIWAKICLAEGTSTWRAPETPEPGVRYLELFGDSRSFPNEDHQARDADDDRDSGWNE